MEQAVFACAFRNLDNIVHCNTNQLQNIVQTDQDFVNNVYTRSYKTVHNCICSDVMLFLLIKYLSFCVVLLSIFS